MLFTVRKMQSVTAAMETSETGKLGGSVRLAGSRIQVS